MDKNFFDIRHSVILSFLFFKFDAVAGDCSLIMGVFQALFRKIDEALYKLFHRELFLKSVIVQGLLKSSKYFGFVFTVCFVVMMNIPDSKWKNQYMIPILAIFLLFYLISADKRKRSSDFFISKGLSTEYGSTLGFNAFDLSFLIFHLFFITATLFSQRFEISINYLLLVVFAFIWAFVLMNYFIDEGDLEILSGAMAISLFVQLILAVAFMIFLPKESNLLYVDTSITQGFSRRISGSFGNPNIFAEFLVITIPYLCVMILNAKTRIRYLWIAGLLLSFYVLIMTGTRAAWVTVLCSLGLFTLIKKPKMFIPLVIVGIGLLFVLPNNVYIRFMSIFNLRDTSIGMRWNIYRSTFYMIEKNIFGVGLGSAVYKNMFKDYNIMGIVGVAHSHNTFLQIWVEQGIFALIWFLIMIVSIALKFFWYFKTPFKGGFTEVKGEEIGNLKLDNIMIGAFVSFVGIMVMAFSEHVWFYYRIQIALWTNLCVLFLCFRMKHSAQKFEEVKSGEEVL